MQGEAPVNTPTSRCDAAAFDVVICGGGLVGASLAVALGELPLRIAVVEARAPMTTQQPGSDERATAISYVSQKILATMGVWRELADTATAIRKIHVSERGGFGVVWIGPEYTQGEALGYVLSNRIFTSVLERAMQARGVELLSPATFETLHRDHSHVEVNVRMRDTERQLKTRLLIAADGAGSRVRRALGIKAQVRDYEQTAILANVTPEYGHDNIAYERFTASGPLAVLPLEAMRCKTVWTVRSDQVDAILALDDHTYVSELQSRFGERLGRFSRLSKRQAYPLRMVRAARQSRARALLMGNAAHSLHPVAAQGFNLSLRDVATLAESIAGAVHRGVDIGSDEVIEDYVSQRRRDQSRTAALTDGLNRIFSNPFAPVAAARSLGQLVMDLSPPLKRRFVRHNLGLTGHLPRLARGLKLESKHE